METPKQDKYGFKEAFDTVGEGLQKSYARSAIEYAQRIAAAEAGTPIKSEDQDSKKLAFLKNEFGAFSGAFFKGQNEGAWQSKFKEMKIPELSDFVRKNPNGPEHNPLMNNQIINDYKWTAALAKLEKGGVRDFRQAQKFDIQESSGRIALRTEKDPLNEQFSYDVKKFALAIFGESLDGDRKFSILPYAHTDKENKITSKTLIVLNDAQRQKVRQFIIDRLKKMM